jgi:hypothetical protein
MTERDDSGRQVSARKDRRSGIDRRWIKAPYDGQERRSGENRRRETSPKNPLLPIARSPINAKELEKLLVSTTLQLEAVTRILINRGLIDSEELRQVLSGIRHAYQSQNDA